MASTYYVLYMKKKISYFKFGEETPKIKSLFNIHNSDVFGVVTTGVVNISSFGSLLLPLWCCSDDDDEEVVEDAISEVVWLTLFKIELEEKCPRVAESGSNLGVVSISSEDVEDRLLLLWSVSLFVLFFEEVWFWEEAIEAIEADPPISRPVILLVANMSQRNHFEALQKKIESVDYLENLCILYEYK